VTLAALERNLSLDDAAGLADMVKEVRIEFGHDSGSGAVLLDGRDVTAAIRQSKVTKNSHKLADLPAVRQLLIDQQRQIARQATSGTKQNCLVTEGRDQGTVVFAEAEYKFYLDATAECRAKRRWEQLQKMGSDDSYEEILAAQQNRDQRDMTREVGALKKAPDAIVIDTTNMTLEDVVEEMYRRVAR
jgi:CMP/dCMP kinase